MIERVMMRCTIQSCRRWWSVGPNDEPKCGCGGELAPEDMKAHMASLPARAAVHNHLSKTRQPKGACEGCDAEYMAEQRAKEEAKRAPPTESK